jgi:hypothetical protein
MAAAVAHVYRYVHPSDLLDESRGPRLRLATSGGTVPNPYFFEGKLLRPPRAGALLRGLMQVVQSRHHINPAVLHKHLVAVDPVVTSNDDRLRFEGFSACGSAYARVDLLPHAVAGQTVGRGTTNVDFNSPMLAALARLRDGDDVRLAVGSAEVRLERQGTAVVEKKVQLPVRWIKGFAEVHAYQPRLTRMYDVPAIEAQRFLRALSATRGRTSSWVVAAGKGLRLSQCPTPRAVPVAGVERLRVLEDLVRHARTLRIYADGDSQVSAWELVLDEARFHLVLSPAPARGFSGEGQLLADLAGGRWKEALPGVQASLFWQSLIDEGAIAGRLGQAAGAVRAALAALAARGLVGYDLDSEAYFHRELPFDLGQVEELQPRLCDARRLVAECKVRLVRREGATAELYVQGTDVEHRVRLTAEGFKCTCRWYAKHQGQCGPCKHVLAAQLTLDGEGGRGQDER